MRNEVYTYFAKHISRKKITFFRNLMSEEILRVGYQQYKNVYILLIGINHGIPVFRTDFLTMYPDTRPSFNGILLETLVSWLFLRWTYKYFRELFPLRLCYMWYVMFYVQRRIWIGGGGQLCPICIEWGGIKNWWFVYQDRVHIFF